MHRGTTPVRCPDGMRARLWARNRGRRDFSQTHASRDAWERPRSRIGQTQGSNRQDAGDVRRTERYALKPSHRPKVHEHTSSCASRSNDVDRSRLKARQRDVAPAGHRRRCRRGDGPRAADRCRFRMAIGTVRRLGIAHWKHGAVARRRRAHEPITSSWRTPTRFAAHWSGAPDESVAIGTARSGRRHDHSGRLERRGGTFSRPVDVVQLYLPHTTLAARCRTRPTGRRTGRSPGADRDNPILVTSRLLLSAADVTGRQRGAGRAVQAATHAICLATRLLAAHTGSPDTVAAGAAAGWRPRPCAAPSSACARTAMCDVSLACAGCRRPACPASTSAAPSRTGTGALPAAPRLRQHRLEQAMNDAARHRRVRRLGRGRARLRLADRLCRCVSKVDRGIAKRLAATHALAAIALQSRQSRWGISTFGSLGIMVPTPETETANSADPERVTSL